MALASKTGSENSIGPGILSRCQRHSRKARAVRCLHLSQADRTLRRATHTRSLWSFCLNSLMMKVDLEKGLRRVVVAICVFGFVCLSAALDVLERLKDMDELAV